MKIAYNFSILRYIHDPVSREFVNVGVAVYAPAAQFFQARCDTHYARAAAFFGSAEFDGNIHLRLIHYIESQVNAAGAALTEALPLGEELSLPQRLARVLPPDDSAIQFSEPGAGLTGDPARTLQQLFQRYVEEYSPLRQRKGRQDEDVWGVFRAPLARRQISSRLAPKTIAAADFNYEFKHAWKNEQWRVYEPVSLDLLEPATIADKAARWLGRAACLRDSTEKFELNLLLGEPADSRLQASVIKAKNILNKIKGPKQIIGESEAEQFAADLEKEMAKHPA